ncbi:MAG: hypothetical protein R3C18_19820 [Planctomycetaceae bacterium]
MCKKDDVPDNSELPMGGGGVDPHNESLPGGNPGLPRILSFDELEGLGEKRQEIARQSEAHGPYDPFDPSQ